MKSKTVATLLPLVAAGLCLLTPFATAQKGKKGGGGGGKPNPDPEPPAPPLIQSPDDARGLGLESLRIIVQNEGVPKPPDVDTYIRNQSGAHILGKALFHDMNVGSDGIQACASCHFHAGADNRVKNQINPDLNRVLDQRNGDVEGYWQAPGDPDTEFHTRGPNETVQRDDYPFVRDIGEGDNVVRDGDRVEPAPGNSNDVTSSQGVSLTQFVDIVEGNPVDDGIPLLDPVFNVDGKTVRRVEPRNTPTTINAVFNFTNFWDGRANPCFNGVDPFGEQNLEAKVFSTNSYGTEIDQEKINIKNASLASQAVGPPLSEFEMSWRGRDFARLGRKMLSLQPLSQQKVDPTDSLLGPWVHPSGYGLKASYETMIKSVFQPKWWRSNLLIHFLGGGAYEVVDAHNVTDPENTFTLMEANFSLFFGLAIQAYESRLIADASPFDMWMMGSGSYVSGFGSMELAGLNIFADKGSCINCHGGPELTNASVRNAQKGQNMIEPMITGDKRPTIYDNGFYNISVTPTVEDLGRGGNDPWGRPLGFTRQFLFEALGVLNIPFDIIGSPIPNLETDGDPTILGFFEEAPVDPDNPEFIPVCKDLDGDGKCGTDDQILLQRGSLDGMFKTPGLRNAELTGPYMHDGSFATLMEVVEFYNRGGNFCRLNIADLDPDIAQIGLSDQEKAELVAFLLSLTDPRVAKRSAPFDGPELRVPHGHEGPECDTVLDLIPATGAAGLPAGQELQPFLNADPFSANVVVGDTDSDGNVRCSADANQ